MGTQLMIIAGIALLVAFIFLSYKIGSKFREGVSRAGFEASESFEMLFFALKIVVFILLEVLFAHLEAQNMSYIMTYRDPDDVYWLTLGLALFAMMCGMAYGIESSLQKDRINVLPNKIADLNIQKDKKQEMIDNLKQATNRGKWNVWLLLGFSVGTHVVIGLMATFTVLNQKQILQDIIDGVIDGNTVNINGPEMLHYSSSLIFTSWLISLVGFAIDIAIGRFSLATEEMYKFAPKEEHIQTKKDLEAKYGVDNSAAKSKESGKFNSSSNEKKVEEQKTKKEDDKEDDKEEKNEISEEALDFYEKIKTYKNSASKMEATCEELKKTIFADKQPDVLDNDKIGSNLKENISVTLDYMLNTFERKDELKSMLNGMSPSAVSENIYSRLDNNDSDDFKKHVKEAISGITSASIDLLKSYAEGSKQKQMLKTGINKFNENLEKMLKAGAKNIDKKFKGEELTKLRKQLSDQNKMLEDKVTAANSRHEKYKNKKKAIQAEMNTVYDAVKAIMQ